MNDGPWIARLPYAEAGPAASLRTRADVAAAEAPPWCWLRGDRLDETLDAALRRVPGLERFREVGGGALAPAGRRVPTLRLPELTWRPIHEVFGVAPPTGLAPARVPAPAPLRLVRATDERPVGCLRTDFAALAAWAVRAPAARLRPLTFACDADGTCLVRGFPPPPIPGVAGVLDGAVAWPAGWRPDPEFAGAALSRVVDAQPGGLVWLDPSGVRETIPAERFVPLTRRAVRFTAARPRAENAP